MPEYWQVKTKDQAKAFSDWLISEQEQGREHLYELTSPHRTNKQNAAFHALCRRLATKLNDAGYDITHPLNSKLDIPWTEQTVKELLFKPVIQAMYHKETTTKLTTEEFSKAVSLTLDRIAQTTGVVDGFTLQESALLNGN